MYPASNSELPIGKVESKIYITICIHMPPVGGFHRECIYTFVLLENIYTCFPTPHDQRINHHPNIKVI